MFVPYEIFLLEMETVNDPGKMKPGEGKDDLNNNMDTDEEEKEGRRRNLSTGVLRCESQEEFPGRLRGGFRLTGGDFLMFARRLGCVCHVL